MDGHARRVSRHVIVKIVILRVQYANARSRNVQSDFFHSNPKI